MGRSTGTARQIASSETPADKHLDPESDTPEPCGKPDESGYNQRRGDVTA
jgi:hypothetical protein